MSEKIRIEIFIPDPPNIAYRNLLQELAAELSLAFGGCTEIPASGKYHSLDGFICSDKITILFSDAPLVWEQDRGVLREYIEFLRRAVQQALPSEESILVSAYPVSHVE